MCDCPCSFETHESQNLGKVCNAKMHTCMRLGLFSEDDIQADGKLDTLATSRQQRAIERERRRLRSVQSLQGISHMLSALAVCQE